MQFLFLLHQFCCKLLDIALDILWNKFLRLHCQMLQSVLSPEIILPDSVVLQIVKIIVDI